jgi:hypothetical protein
MSACFRLRELTEERTSRLAGSVPAAALARPIVGRSIWARNYSSSGMLIGTFPPNVLALADEVFE